MPHIVMIDKMSGIDFDTGRFIRYYPDMSGYRFLKRVLKKDKFTLLESLPNEQWKVITTDAANRHAGFKYSTAMGKIETSYMVSDMGRVKRVRKTTFPNGFIMIGEKIVKVNNHNKGNYHTVTLQGRRQTYGNIKQFSNLVNRLVAKYFVPTWNRKLQAHHIDHDRYNNCASNLVMITFKENMALRRDRPHVVLRRKLKLEAEIECRRQHKQARAAAYRKTGLAMAKLRRAGMMVKDIAKMFGKCDSNVVGYIQRVDPRMAGKYHEINVLRRQKSRQMKIAGKSQDEIDAALRQITIVKCINESTIVKTKNKKV